MACVQPPRHLQLPRRTRQGAVVVLAAFLMIVMLGAIAFAVDVGMLLLARTELQRTADAAAIAAAWEFARQDEHWLLQQEARRTARRYAVENEVLLSGPRLRYNASNAEDGDIVIGFLADFDDPQAELIRDDPDAYNAVRVTPRRSQEVNGEVPLFFGRVLGLDSRATQATATAAVMRRIGGFRALKSGENLPILPITMHEDAWRQLFQDDQLDEWSYNEEDGNVTRGSDGIPEQLLYPEDHDSAGNFGTLDIGPAANSTSHLGHQIIEGISETDLGYHGGELKLNDRGELRLGGDPGLSAGIADDLAAIIGQTRIIPVYRTVDGNGDTAVYTIVKFVGVRIMEVHLTGGDKGLYVQPANIVIGGTIPTTREGTSDYVFSPACLVK
jgi:hypothetical protein